MRAILNANEYPALLLDLATPHVYQAHIMHVHSTEHLLTTKSCMIALTFASIIFYQRMT